MIRVKNKRADKLSWEDAKEGMSLYDHDSIQIIGSASAEVQFADGHIARVGEKTLLVVKRMEEDLVYRTCRSFMVLIEGELRGWTGESESGSGSVYVETPSIRIAILKRKPSRFLPSVEMIYSTHPALDRPRRHPDRSISRSRSTCSPPAKDRIAATSSIRHGFTISTTRGKKYIIAADSPIQKIKIDETVGEDAMIRFMSVVLTFVLSVLFSGGAAWAQQKGLIELRAVVEKDVEVINEAGVPETRRVEAGKVIPGDEVIYSIYYTNSGKEPADKVNITNPIPEHMLYRSGSALGADTTITFSVDGGETYDAMGNLKVTDANGKERPAETRDLTHIRWTLEKSLPHGSEGFVSFRAQLE